MKKIISLTMVLSLIIAMLLPSASFASNNVKIMIDGEMQVFDASPMVSNSSTLVPLRGVFEKLGAEVKWDQKTKTVTIVKLESKIELTVGSSLATVNGKKAQLQEPAQLVDNRTLVPLRFVAESLSAKVVWDGKTRTVSITSLENWLLDKTLNVMDLGLNSYSMELLMDQKMEFAGETMDLSMKMNADMIMEPLQMYTEMVMELFGEEMIIKEYLTEKGYYSFDPTIGVWVKYPDEMLNSLLELSNVQSSNPLAQYELLVNHVEELVAVEGKDHYIVKMKINNEGFMKMMSEVFGMLQGITGEADIEEIFNSITIDEFEFVTFYDKTTFFPVQVNGTTAMTIEVEGETMTMVQSLEGNYSNFNNVKPITIPQEVIDSAVNFEDIEL